MFIYTVSGVVLLASLLILVSGAAELANDTAATGPNKYLDDAEVFRHMMLHGYPQRIMSGVCVTSSQYSSTLRISQLTEYFICLKKLLGFVSGFVYIIRVGHSLDNMITLQMFFAHHIMASRQRLAQAAPTSSPPQQP